MTDLNTADSTQLRALNFPPLRLLHFGYVTRDLELGIVCLEQMFGQSDAIKRYRDVRISTPRGAAVIDYASVKIGDQIFESIRPGQGADGVYAMSMPEESDSVALHHLGSRIDNVDEWKTLIASVTENHIPLLVHGRTGAIDYAYVDLRHILGHVIEYLHYG